LAERKTRGSGNLTIRQLEVFTVASRSATFSEAAKRLGISQPTLSNMVAKIESLLGLRLFDRTTRTSALTAEGERLSVVAQDLVRSFQNSLSSIHDTTRRRGGHLSMAVLPSVASAIAPRAIQLFLSTYPDFNIALHDTSRQDGLVWVLDRVVDFGVLADAPAVSELRCDPLYADHFQVVCNEADAVAGRKTLAWKDIESLPLILTGSAPIRRDIEAAWSRAGVTITPRFEVENIITGLALVSAGLGITILPRVYTPSALNAGLIALPLSNPGFQREISIVRRMDRVLTLPVEHMIDCFKKVFTDFAHETGDRVARTRSTRRHGGR
jgi:DNA-binding transcriptional LysR family regulator